MLEKGNPDALLEISAPEITYFHVMTAQRLDGLPAVRSALEAIVAGRYSIAYEMAESKVQSSGRHSDLTYILVRHIGT